MGLNDNTLNKQDTQKRILIATVISFAFFLLYDYFYIQPQQKALQAQQAKVAQHKQINQTNQAPQVTSTNKDNVAPAVKDIKKNEIISTITTNTSIIQIDNLGRIAQVTLTKTQYIDKEGKAIKLFNADQLRPLEVRFVDSKINNEAFSTNVSVSSKTLDAKQQPKELIITQKLSETTLTKKLKFYPDGHYDLDITTSNPQNYFLTPGYRPNVLVDMYADHGALVIKNDSTLERLLDKKIDSPEEFVGINVVSQFDRYYATTLYNFDKNLQVSVIPNATKSPETFIHINKDLQLHGYIGPKEHKALKALDPRLTDIIEYGWFTFIAKPMFLVLQFIHNIIGNWGWTIVATTILIKLVLFPLAYKGMVGMNRLKELSPKIKAIQEKYKDDKQKASMHMMELYKKENANPMGGCLPMILQIPVFFAIYRVLLNAIELKGSAWILWINDLSSMDPYYVLPILMGITMFVQQKITPNQMQDETQKKIFQFLPVIFTVFFLWFPAGLTLYWFINNLFTVGQQYYVNQIFEKQKEQRHKEHLAHKHHKDK